MNENFNLDFDITSGLKQLNLGRPDQSAFDDYNFAHELAPGVIG
jgi:hypothetical protein